MMALSETNTRTALKSWYMKLTTILQFSYTKWIAIKSNIGISFQSVGFGNGIRFHSFHLLLFHIVLFIELNLSFGWGARNVNAGVRAHFTGIYFWFCISQRWFDQYFSCVSEVYFTLEKSRNASCIAIYDLMFLDDFFKKDSQNYGDAS